MSAVAIQLAMSTRLAVQGSLQMVWWSLISLRSCSVWQQSTVWAAVNSLFCIAAVFVSQLRSAKIMPTAKTMSMPDYLICPGPTVRRTVAACLPSLSAQQLAAPKQLGVHMNVIVKQRHSSTYVNS